MKSNLSRLILAVSLGVTGFLLIDNFFYALGVTLLIWSNNVPTGDLPR